MTILASVALGILFFIIPFLTGNIYSLISDKKKVGIAGLYFSGVAIVCAGLFVMQMAIIKFKFSFFQVTNAYHTYFMTLMVLGIVAFFWKLLKEKTINWDIVWEKRFWWIYGLILLQGILYIVLKNPYFESNALLETTNITMETETIYQYNAYSHLPAVVGFPLANKLMFLPILYAYVSNVFGLSPAILFNFIVPAVTFLGFYGVMILWVQRLAKEHHMKWQRVLAVLLVVVQVGDSWMHFTSFRILHEGYSGEAMFFGVLFVYALYELKNNGYLTGLACIGAFPGLVKYSAVTDFLKGFSGYWKDAATYGGMLLLYILAVSIYVLKQKRASLHLFNLNLTICVLACEIWTSVMGRPKKIWRKVADGAMLIVCLMLCGNITIISDATTWRTNPYGIGENEYVVLETLAKESDDEQIRVMACKEVNSYICRGDFPMVPVVGYDISGGKTVWYSYETYEENYRELFNCIQYPSEETESEIMRLKDEILIDYVVLKRVTEKLPIENNDELKCVLETPSYLVYSVDKK